LGRQEALLAGRAVLLVQLGVEVVFVNVAQGDHVAEVAGVADVAGAFAADADAGEAEFAIGAVGGPGGRAGGGGEEVPGPDGRGLEEAAAMHARSHETNPRSVG